MSVVDLRGKSRGVGARRIGGLLVGAVLVVGLPSQGVAAAATEEDGETEAQPAPEPPRLRVHGFADVFYAYNDNHPEDGDSFFAGTGTTAKRADEFSLNQAQIELSAEPAPLGFRLALGFGTAVEVVHAGEPEGSAVGQDVWRNVVYASVLYRAPVGKGLLFEGGIYPCHVGFEAFNSKDNWNYTRSWLGELSPYYVTGLRVSYPFTDRWTGELHVVNGWQLISDNNSATTFGTRVAYSGPRASVSFNTLVGPELPDDDEDWRILGDVVVSVPVGAFWTLGATVDAARQDQWTGETAHWAGAAVYARYAPPESKLAVALRLERFDDDDGAISGTPQRLDEATLTLEYRPTPNLIVKLEARHDKSTADAFAAEAAADGSPVFVDGQTLILLGVVAAF
jgi:hypothetical protein